MIKFNFEDPELLEEFLRPVAGEISIRPAIETSFNAQIRLKNFGKLGLFQLNATSLIVKKEPQEYFYGLTVPIGMPFSTKELNKVQNHDLNSAHILDIGRPFELFNKTETKFLVANFYNKEVKNYTKNILQEDIPPQRELSPILSFQEKSNRLLTSLARAWTGVSLNHAQSEISLSTLEDDLMYAFIDHIHHGASTTANGSKVNPKIISNAEDYIYANLKKIITRETLAIVTGCSARTLSRHFLLKHGVGPMDFIRQRRAIQAYFDLLHSDPYETTVTEIAYRYGFDHLGKFPSYFSRIFGATPQKILLS